MNALRTHPFRGWALPGSFGSGDSPSPPGGWVFFGPSSSVAQTRARRRVGGYVWSMEANYKSVRSIPLVPRAELPGWGRAAVGAALGLLLAATMWQFSEPFGGGIVGFMLLPVLWAVTCLTWLVYLLIGAFTRRSFRGAGRWHLVVPACAAIAYLLVLTNAPFTARFELSQSAMNKAAAKVMADPRSAGHPPHRPLEGQARGAFQRRDEIHRPRGRVYRRGRFRTERERRAPQPRWRGHLHPSGWALVSMGRKLVGERGVLARTPKHMDCCAS